MLSCSQLNERVRKVLQTGPVAEITHEDREAMAVGLVIQGYSSGRAAYLAFVELEDTDGALQMLARHRIATLTSAQPATSATTDGGVS